MSRADETTTSEAAIRDEVTRFLRTNFPQIAMHGGQAAVLGVDVEDGFVSIRLGGYCHGCGLSPMTTEAIQNRLPAAIDGIEHVAVETGDLSR
jgi:Fe-S cluster biogenesis protein NfuA